VTIAELKRAVGRRPFAPFYLCLADGRQYDVRHRNQIGWPEDDAQEIGYVYSDDDYEMMIELTQITSIRWIPRPAENAS
jgi:hypothetical protein